MNPHVKGNGVGKVEVDCVVGVVGTLWRGMSSWEDEFDKEEKHNVIELQFDGFREIVKDCYIYVYD